MRLLAACCIAAAAVAADPTPAASPLAGLRVDGEQLFAATCSVRGLPLQELRCVPTLKDGVLRLDQLKAAGFGGTVAGFHEVELERGVHRGELHAQGIDLIGLIRQFGGSADQLAGKVAASVVYRVDPALAERVTAAVDLDISEARLVQLPVLVVLLAGDPSTARNRDRLQAKLEIHGERIDVLRAELTSPSAALAISGTVTLGGDLDLRIRPRLRFAIIDAVPGIGGFLSRGLANFAESAGFVTVRGHITKPVLRFDPFGD